MRLRRHRENLYRRTDSTPHEGVMYSEHRTGGEICKLLLPPVWGMRKRSSECERRACIYCLERALEDIRFALCSYNP